MFRRFAKIVRGDLEREGPPVTAEPVWLDVEPSVAKAVRWVSYASIALSSACSAAIVVFILTLVLALRNMASN
jgi:hypothetical protein